jgi:hypothetical protein
MISSLSTATHGHTACTTTTENRSEGNALISLRTGGEVHTALTRSHIILPEVAHTTKYAQ